MAVKVVLTAPEQKVQGQMGLKKRGNYFVIFVNETYFVKDFDFLKKSFA